MRALGIAAALALVGCAPRVEVVRQAPAVALAHHTRFVVEALDLSALVIDARGRDLPAAYPDARRDLDDRRVERAFRDALAARLRARGLATVADGGDALHLRVRLDRVHYDTALAPPLYVPGPVLHADLSVRVLTPAGALLDELTLSAPSGRDLPDALDQAASRIATYLAARAFPRG